MKQLKIYQTGQRLFAAIALGCLLLAGVILLEMSHQPETAALVEPAEDDGFEIALESNNIRCYPLGNFWSG
ncbi:hypothetical protein [Candidatus Leptofilum sp.]|uniref:hypothetical protein n=1 Tax=Candidatus Leptofilum sp. TaxID=3241576 RepID=UPI003B5AA158